MSTSLERTYRYLRIGIAGMVVVIFASIAVAIPAAGWLTSISDYFYSPARTAFTGALIAVSLALLALSGRGLERALLDAAALFAPLIALIPTTIPDASCEIRCIPPTDVADVGNGIGTYLIAGVVALAVAALLAALGQVSWGAVAPTGTLALVVLIALGLTWSLAPAAVLAQGHYVATVAFFALFAAVAMLNAFTPGGYRTPYVTIAALLVLVLVAYIAFLPHAAEMPVILLAEAAALLLFGTFWVVQGVEKWNAPNPTLSAEHP